MEQSVMELLKAANEVKNLWKSGKISKTEAAASEAVQLYVAAYNKKAKEIAKKFKKTPKLFTPELFLRTRDMIDIGNSI